MHSDQGLVYHLKQGLSKQVLSSGGFLASPHSGPLRVCGFPLASSMQRTSRLFTPRPQVVLHRSQSWASQCAGQFLSPQGWMARGLVSIWH